MTNFNFLSKFNNRLGELSSRMSLVGVSCDASDARVVEIRRCNYAYSDHRSRRCVGS